ncbi:MAG: molybdopterin-guanine dinucleotide biosynthesis protein B [Nitriliruptoraceae bacterium]
MPIVAIVGDAGSGKTLLAEQVVAALVAEQLRVAYVKHAPHGFQPDRTDADNQRVSAAGADPVAVLGPDGLLELTVASGETTEQLAQLLGGLRGDVVLLEGFSASRWPKVRAAVEGRQPRGVADPILADVTRPADERFTDDTVRSVVKVVAEERERLGPDHAVLHADGRDVPLRGFAQRMVTSTVRGVASTLRGVGDADHLTIEVERQAGRRR